MTFSVLHIKNNRSLIEPTVDHSGSHVKWNVTSLSPVGPIIQTSQSVEHHGVVLVYKQQGSDNNSSNSFHIYLATNSSSDIKVSTAGYCALLYYSYIYLYILFWHAVEFIQLDCFGVSHSALEVSGGLTSTFSQI